MRPLDVAARMLGRRAYTSGELEARLTDKGYQPATAERTVARCIELGWVDDARFARDRAEALRRRGAGRLKITADLEGRGIDRRLLDEALREVSDGRTEQAWAALALEQARVDPDRSPARAWRLLASRGFDEHVIADVVGEPE